MHKLILLLGLVVAACAAGAPVPGYRDTARPLYSSAVLDPARLIGTWAQVGDFAPEPGCKATGISITKAGAGETAPRIAGQLCLAGRPTPVSGALVPIGPGRFSLGGLADPLWVLWADADARTLVIGTPSGRFGMVLDRQVNLPPDRLTAARAVLAWNGYDLGRFQITP